MKLQSKTADFAPGAATYRTGRNLRRQILAHSLHYVKT